MPFFNIKNSEIETPDLLHSSESDKGNIKYEFRRKAIKYPEVGKKMRTEGVGEFCL